MHDPGTIADLVTGWGNGIRAGGNGLPTVTGTLAVVWIALYTGQTVADHWFRTSAQAREKGQPVWVGRMASARHAAVVTETCALAVALAVFVTGAQVRLLPLLLGLAVNAVSRYRADRRTTPGRIAAFTGKYAFWALGLPRPGHDDNEAPGAGHYAQTWHMCWLFFAALVIAAGSR